MNKKIFTCIFIIAIWVCFIKVTKYYNSNIFMLLSNDYKVESNIEAALTSNNVIKEIYGITNRFLSPNEIENTVKDKDGFLLPLTQSDFDVAWAARNIINLKNFCNNNNIDFAYVSFPSKIMSDDYWNNYYIDTNNEKMRTSFLTDLKDNQVNVLDIRSLMEEKGYSNKDIFYKTDHHWNTRSGLFAAREMSSYIETQFGLNTIVENIYDENLSFKDYKGCWLGETGRLYSISYVGSLDDFTLIKPTYNTSIEMIIPNSIDIEGDFSLLVNEKMYNAKFDYYKTSLHYSYMPDAGLNTIIKNNNVQDGAKVLLIKDSFSMVVVPFLSLSCSEVNMWDLRENTESLLQYIEDNDFDIVIVAYTDFWRKDMYDFK